MFTPKTTEQIIIQAVRDLPATDYRLKMMPFDDLQALTDLNEADLVTGLNNLYDCGLLFNGYIDEETGKLRRPVLGICINKLNEL
ncbi:hypothetical protein DLJ48_06945 [Oenococcus sicerae]|uniref:Uncharacterized protein n=1 Tax=Oenococcus sicerae TaxID=2203724 RepID=A0ABX5QNU1_9LACO|nr:hypothetical protein [Oenococcus sicerae]QAS70274.1 hypothetical protein DLJ48_06945 [Oenococcus sicerae]